MDSPNITQKEAFLKYLQRMDIEMLEIILDDSIIYFGASKKVFLIINPPCFKKGRAVIPIYQFHRRPKRVYRAIF